ncbi:DUF1223 domain-containing protein [Devosia limi]|uniref:DUF1223 domain-containing protein n=1 Tax=Devosia limi DSM 17137 TaxID=1121477 RepID=A0A1M5CHK6_9HYPH|nr:DUF1223 domain-containing protein [Devosia limi]SHF54243.1 hypothetical protein SAMN02745223_02921 [Devosia limi DSM 17137]
MTSRILGLTALLSLLPGAIGVASAELSSPPKAVLELFTSQGCPFSPGADRLVSELAERGDVITLNYHVDYWDYAGWKDTFGSAANAELQRDYASLWDTRKLYTPQLIVAGTTDVLGSDEPGAVEAIEASSMTRQIDLTRNGDTLRIVVPEQGGARPSIIWLVTYIEQDTVTIQAGDNAGKTLSYDHIVTNRTQLAALGAGMGARLALNIERVLPEPGTGVAVLVQEDVGGMPGPITGGNTYER